MIYKYIVLFVIYLGINFFTIQTLDAKSLESKIEADSNLTYPLHEAVKKGNISLVKKLLDQGYNIEERLPETSYEKFGSLTISDGMTVFEIAFEKRNIEMMQLLLDHGANPYNYKLEKTILSSGFVFPCYECVISKIIIGYCSAIGDRIEKGRLLPNTQDQKFYIDLIKRMIAAGVVFDKYAYYFDLDWSEGTTPLEILNSFKDSYVDKGWKNNKEIKAYFKVLEDLITK
jgi:ankyrin repeat protein